MQSDGGVVLQHTIPSSTWRACPALHCMQSFVPKAGLLAGANSLTEAGIYFHFSFWFAPSRELVRSPITNTLHYVYVLTN